ncbi:hypothetical protein Syun_027750 [Stephania yunnanensis]|uniref:Uncharacterized protein n=1 Tax=Stephania yunnanensis TaxID=152371 RepID=A0AAP0EGH4_9MAGN
MEGSRAYCECSDNKENIPPLLPAKPDPSSAAIKMNSLRKPLQDITHLFYPSVQGNSVLKFSHLLLLFLLSFYNLRRQPINLRKRRANNHDLELAQKTRWMCLRKNFRYCKTQGDLDVPVKGSFTHKMDLVYVRSTEECMRVCKEDLSEGVTTRSPVVQLIILVEFTSGRGPTDACLGLNYDNISGVLV